MCLRMVLVYVPRARLTYSAAYLRLEVAAVPALKAGYC